MAGKAFCIRQLGRGSSKVFFRILRYSRCGLSNAIRVVGTEVTAFAGGCDGNDVSNGVGPADRDGVGETAGLAGTGVPVTGVPVDAGPVQPAARIIPANKKIRRRVLFFIITGSLQEPINSLVMWELMVAPVFLWY